MIISIAGRCGSGKSELAKMCVEKYNFKRLYFALPLKTLVSNLLDKTIEELNQLKNVEAEYVFDDEKLKFISDETNIPLDIIEDKLKDKTLHTVREIFQYVGTDLIRTYNNNWHIDRIKRMIEPNVDYVFDDVRFKNEKTFLESIGSINFFIVRPKLDNVSNHISETTLRWQDFDFVIINDKSIEYLKFNWDNLLKNGVGKTLISRSKMINKISNEIEVYDDFMNQIDPFNVYDSLFIHKDLFLYSPKYFIVNRDDIEKIESFNNKLYRVYYKNGNIEIVTNSLMIEDLKFYEQ